MNEMVPDKKSYQVNRRYMCWCALGMMVVTTAATIIDPARMDAASAQIMMMYGSLSALVGAYFALGNTKDVPKPKVNHDA
tara:strand:+ start:696 stop:935 length:240 start_codon:yes stop_codon:yes gene_type:complete